MGARFSVLIQTGFGAYPVYCTVGTGAPSLGVEWPMRGAEHPSPYNAEVKDRKELYLYSPSTPSWSVLE
jgi:hypothetical protein